MLWPVLIAVVADGFLQPSPPVILRSAESGDVPLYRTASVLIAESILSPEGPSDLAILAAALQRDLEQRFTRRNRNENELIFAQGEDGTLAGCIGIDVQRLSQIAQTEQQLGRSSPELDDRALLSSLAVSQSYRRRGIGQKLCKRAEDAARSWGCTEVLLKVESTNSKARSLCKCLAYENQRSNSRPLGGKHVCA